MASDSYTDKMEFVEEFSLKIEELGYPHIYGQILGWLLICEPPHQSFPDLMDNLDISKASVSNMTRMMLERGLIEKVRIKGERQVYFKLKEGSLIDFIEYQMQVLMDMEKITKKGLEFVRSDKTTDSERLDRTYHFHQFIAKELPAVIDKFKKENDIYD